MSAFDDAKNPGLPPQGPPPIEPPTWYLAYGEQQYGPYDLATARNYAASNPNGRAWREGFADWVPITQLSELYSAPAPPPGAPPITTQSPPRQSNTMLWVLIMAAAGGFFIIIMGIVAAIAIPNLMNATQRGRAKRSMSDMRSIATAIEAFAVDNNRYPEASTASELESQISPTFIKTLPTKDGWGRPYRINSNSKTYLIISLGKDGEPDWQGSEGPVTTFNSDIVYRDGQFVQYLEGASLH